MQRSQRFKRVTKLPPFASVVIPPASITPAEEDLTPLADGFSADMCFLLERLGGLRVNVADYSTTFDGESTASDFPTYSPEDVNVDGLLREFDASWIVMLRLEWDTGPRDPILVIDLCGEGGERAWTGTFSLVGGAVWQSRLTIASELVAAATGEPVDVRPLLRQGPESIEAYRLLCEAYSDRLPPQDRLDRCVRVTELEPETGDAWMLLPDLLAACGRADEAEQLVSELPQRIPENGRALLKRGLFRMRAGDQQAAQEDFLESARKDSDGLALYEIGRYLIAVGEEDAGAETLQRAVNARCADPYLYEQLGVIRANEGQEVAAVVYWERALSLDPSLSGILANLALGHHRLGNEERADELFVLAEEQAPDHFATHYNLGLYYQDLKSWELARKHLERSIGLRPTLAVLHLNLGVVLTRLGQLREARAAYEEAARLDLDGPVGRQASDELSRINIAPVDPMLDAREYFQKGAERIKANRSEKAIPYLKEAVKIAPRYWQAWFYLGTCYRLVDKWEAAVEAFRRVVSIKESQADAHNELSVALGQLGRREEALIHARQAHDLRPEDPGIISNLGLALMELEQFDEARHHFQRARKIAPDDDIVERCIEELQTREKKA